MPVSGSMKRPPFDANCEFVANAAHGKKFLLLAGHQYLDGEQIDKSAVDARRLRQMYDTRLIRLAPGQQPAAPPPKKRAVGPTDLIHPGGPPPAKEKEAADKKTRAVSRRVKRVKRIRARAA